ncbi:MAG: streptogramin lyase [Chlamydiales bacterium]|jgi:streptogramin lyase
MTIRPSSLSSSPLLACAALAASATANPAPLTDEILLSGFSSASVDRYDGGDGSVLGELGPGDLLGVLGSAIGLDGRIYVCSEGNDRIVRFDAATGDFVDNFIIDDPATPADETGGLNGPSAIVFGRDGFAYVASFNTDSILRYDGETGAFDRVFVTTTPGNLNGPDAGMVFGPDGNLYVPSYFTDRIKRYDGVTGDFIGNFVGPAWANLDRPRAVIFPGDGFAYVASERNDMVLRVDEATGQTTVEELIVDDPATPADETGGLDGPTGLAFGPDGLLYVASIQNNSVLRYEPDGTFVDVFISSGLGGVQLPTFMAFRPDALNTCTGAPNSTGRSAHMGALGFTSISADDFTLTATSVPPDVSGLFFYGNQQLAIPFGDGIRCVGGSTFRLRVTQASSQGWASHAVDFAQPPRPAGQIQAGSTWYFQFWYRDPSGPQGSGFNTSDALEVQFDG